MAPLELYVDGKIAAENLPDFVHNTYVNTLGTREFCAAVVGEHDRAIVVNFFRELARVYRQQFMMEELLQSSHDCFDQKLDRINALKNFSFVFFTIAAAITAAVAAANAGHKRPAVAAAAAAASIVLSALGNWMHSLLKKDESAVKKHKEIISGMIMWTQIAIQDLLKIREVADKLQLQTKSMSEMADDDVDVNVTRKKVAAVEKIITELQGKDKDYSWHMRCATQLLVPSIFCI